MDAGAEWRLIECRLAPELVHKRIEERAARKEGCQTPPGKSTCDNVKRVGFFAANRTAGASRSTLAESRSHSQSGERLVAATHFRNNISKHNWRRRKMKKQFYQCRNRAVAIIYCSAWRWR